MDASIKPLAGKYYGTVVQVEDAQITVWMQNGVYPSDRQLQDWNMTLKEARADGMMSDNHYETAKSYRVAEAIVEALKEL